MKSLFHTTLLLAFLLLTGILHAQEQEVLTNQSIVQMVTLGFDATLIESKIKTANNDFDVSTSALMALKADSVPNSVIAEMMTAADDPSRKVVDANDLRSPHRPGVYYFDGQGNLVELLSSVTSGTKTRNSAGARWSYGISKAKVVSQVAGISSRTTFSTAPKFYFYFDQQSTGFNAQSIAQYGFMSASSPNEFVLARMDVRKGTRELVVFSANAYTTEYGVDEKQTVQFEIAQVAPGVYEVSIAALTPGQYCFVYSGNSPSSQARVHDFGVL